MSTPSSSRNSTHASPHASLNALLFRKLMPLLVISYVISFLDRTNIALAKHTMSIDLGLSSAAYGLGAGLFFLTYAAFEIPSNLVMHRVGARFWITRIMVTWGVLSVAMAFVRGETSFYVMRLLLGVAEAGLFPGVMLYLTYWFGREDRARATGYFLLGVCVANIVGGPLGGALLEMDGVLGFHGWQWLFMVEGAPAVLLAIVVWKILPDRPTRASWLPREEALALERRLAAEQEAIGTGHGGHTFRAALADRQIWLSIFVYFCHQLTIYTVIFFLPGIIGSSGHFSPFVVGVLTSTRGSPPHSAPPFAALREQFIAQPPHARGRPADHGRGHAGRRLFDARHRLSRRVRVRFDVLRGSVDHLHVPVFAAFRQRACGRTRARQHVRVARRLRRAHGHGDHRAIDRQGDERAGVSCCRADCRGNVQCAVAARP